MGLARGSLKRLIDVELVRQKARGFGTERLGKCCRVATAGCAAAIGTTHVGIAVARVEALLAILERRCHGFVDITDRLLSCRLLNKHASEVEVLGSARLDNVLVMLLASTEVPSRLLLEERTKVLGNGDSERLLAGDEREAPSKVRDHECSRLADATLVWFRRKVLSDELLGRDACDCHAPLNNWLDDFTDSAIDSNGCDAPERGPRGARRQLRADRDIAREVWDDGLLGEARL
jgi:hypothetical protein